MNIPSHLLNEHYNDRYFDVVDAFEEAKHIHIAGSSIVDRVKVFADRGDIFRIGETGFGPGRVLIALMDSLHTLSSVNFAVQYSSAELYPLSVDRMESILKMFQDRADSHIQKLISAYSRLDISTPGWHSVNIHIGSGIIELRLFVGEALQMVLSLDAPCDAWFLDGHGPKKNPDIWRSELLKAIGDKTASGGAVTTYTVAGDVKRGLTAAGFALEKLPGFGGKKEVLRGII
ncbi:MAG: tRNA (5-methylaminomethyl-2-thiouridine)(34)-methyltransferase MnmD [Chitinispirillia bacterium]|nr:tRNA (5-methylaminomethyl-2-thiouridine)(34)-methyltransferase MnmD [Chitinispirillia bacterium]